MLKELVERLRPMLVRAKGAGLDDAERISFDELRSELARIVVAGQGLTVGAGQTYRQALRVAQMLKIDLTSEALCESTVTVNLSTGGFAAMLPGACATEQRFRFVMHTLPEPLGGQARLLSLTRRGSVFVASFSIEEMRDTDRDRLELVILEAVLSQLRV